jgi:ribosomal protein S18 acetylase RimI-like enzyme
LKADPGDYNVYFVRSLTSDLPEPMLPPGYTIRPARGKDDLDAYQSLVGFAAVNREHQQELFASDEYSCLVVVSPHGEFAGYCESSICRAEWQGSGQRIGWIDYIETKAGQQKLGLGQAVLWAGLRRLRAWGADTAMLVTLSSNIAANRLYAKTGFERMAVVEMPRYEKHIGEA